MLTEERVKGDIGNDAFCIVTENGGGGLPSMRRERRRGGRCGLQVYVQKNEEMNLGIVNLK